MKAVCFGAAGGGIRLYDEICRKYDVVAFADNDKKSGGDIAVASIYLLQNTA